MVVGQDTFQHINPPLHMYHVLYFVLRASIIYIGVQVYILLVRQVYYTYAYLASNSKVTEPR